MTTEIDPRQARHAAVLANLDVADQAVLGEARRNYMGRPGSLTEVLRSGQGWRPAPKRKSPPAPPPDDPAPTRVTRALVRSVACLYCHAAPGEKCVRNRDKAPREANHADRERTYRRVSKLGQPPPPPEPKRELKAKPTMYAGVEFRSRLESRWAAFFDLTGWQWSFEPFDGNRYIPDFLVYCSKEPLLIEVKPAVTKAQYEAPIPKIFRTSATHWVHHDGVSWKKIRGSTR